MDQMKNTARKLEPDAARNFCRAYLDALDVEGAARRSGVEDGYRALERRCVQQNIERARHAAVQMVGIEDIVRQLCRIAFSKPNDGVALVCNLESPASSSIDLMAVSEFKCKDGAREIKFFDRVKALEVLAALLGAQKDGNATAAEEFFLALEDAAPVCVDESGGLR